MWTILVSSTTRPFIFKAGFNRRLHVYLIPSEAIFAPYILPEEDPLDQARGGACHIGAGRGAVGLVENAPEHSGRGQGRVILC